MKRLQEALALLTEPWAGRPGLRDAGLVRSEASGDPAVRAFHELHLAADALPRADYAACVRRRLDAFRRACRLLNEEGARFDVQAVVRLGEALEREERPGWPFFGWKAAGDSAALVLYLADPAPSAARPCLPSDGLLHGLGVEPSDAPRLEGRLDCAALALRSDGRSEAKVYVRLPAPAPAVGVHAAWWSGLPASVPVRFWTQAVRLSSPGSPVKTEIHFDGDAAPASLLERRPPDAWTRSALERLARDGRRVTCLAEEAGRPYVYYR